MRDLFLEIKLGGLAGEVRMRPEPVPEKPTAWKESELGIGGSVVIGDIATMGGDFVVYGTSSLRADGSIELDAGDDSKMEIEFPVVQPQRTVFSTNEFWLSVNESCTITLDATAYSSSAKPFSTQTRIDAVVERDELTYREILDRLRRDDSPA